MLHLLECQLERPVDHHHHVGHHHSQTPKCSCHVGTCGVTTSRAGCGDCCCTMTTTTATTTTNCNVLPSTAVTDHVSTSTSTTQWIGHMWYKQTMLSTTNSISAMNGHFASDRSKITSWTVHFKRSMARRFCMVVILIVITIQFHWTSKTQLFCANSTTSAIVSNVGHASSISIPTEDYHLYDSSSRSVSSISSSSSSYRGGNGGEVTWEWKRFHQMDQDTTYNTSYPSKNNLLISQYDSGTDALYGTLLNLTSRVNTAYAKKYSFDYVTLHGIAYQTVFDTTFRIPQPSRATYSKVNLLRKAIQLKYDYLLILDSDAMMYDFDRDISLLIPEHKMVMAHQVHDFDAKQFYNINVGVILFNLHHPMLRRILWLWNIVCFLQIMIGVSDNDQNPIQRILQAMGARQLIEGNRQEFAYNNGTFIKHFKRVNSKSWTDRNMDNRIIEIQSTVDEVCAKYSPICDSVI